MAFPGSGKRLAFPGSGKRRAERIPPDYYKRPGSLVDAKFVLSGVAVVVSLAYIGWMFLSGGGHVAFTHGPVAEVHAAIESNCTQCHEPFVPIRDDTLAASWGHSNVFGKNFSNSISIKKCQDCHAAAAHHVTSHPDQEVGCSSCHQDHGGRLASLLKMPDLACTGCHSDLGKHRSDHPDITNPELASSIDRFFSGGGKPTEAGHPDFRSLEKDPGTIKFTHAQHMRAGIPNSSGGTPGADASPHVLSKIPEQYRERYRLEDQSDKTKDAEHVVQLQCTTCHRVDRKDGDAGPAGAHAASRSPGRTDGAYMLPVSFENDCKACHQLSIRPGDTAEANQLEHGRTPAQIHDALLGRIIVDGHRSPPTDARDGKSEPAEPFVLQDLPPAELESAKETAEKLEDELFKTDLSATDRHLRNTCFKCHTPWEGKAESRLPRVAPAAIPEVWLKLAKFDHSSHRTVNCGECHSKARESNNHSDVLIEGWQTCIRCHSPGMPDGSPAANKQPAGDGNRGGASFRCVECHRYHVGEKPPAWYHDWNKASASAAK